MPVFTSHNGRRRRIFRSIAVLIFWGILFCTFIFVTGFLIPESREPVALRNAFASYERYYTPQNDKKIALTFDDGPTPRDTDEIISILQQHKVPATFFFIGEHVLLYPDIAARVARAGFEIGNHTFTHSVDVHSSPQRLQVELAATTRIIERTTGIRPRYYRPPYLFSIGVDPAPNPWIPALEANRWALALGYLPVGSDIDPRDWDATNAQAIVDHFLLAIQGGGHIVLMHDSPHTAEALKVILPYLTANGYSIVPLSELLLPLGESTAPARIIPPPVAPLEAFYIHMIANFEWMLMLLGVTAIGFVFLRLLILVLLLQFGRKTHKPLRRYPTISVLIPAYNEEENIESTIKSVLSNSYPRREIIIINDGSTDRTQARVEALASALPNGALRLVSTQNQGKARAIMAGVREAEGEVLVILDADAVLKEGALHAFAKHFADPSVGAVSGKVYTASLKGVLNKLQALEYCVGQNIEKAAFSTIGAVGVVPGPAGAWRAKAVMEAGGFPTDTLVEDQDMTLTLMRRGWKIVYEPQAVAYTETPATLNHFLTQRFRWVFGTMQCFWKHSDVLLRNPRSPMSYLLLPHTFIFSIVLPLTYPFVDSILIAHFMFGVWEEALVPILVFTLVDMGYAAWGLRGERMAWKLIAVVPLLRLVYRQLLYYTVLRGVVRALEGSGAAWNKFAKAGATQRFYEEELALLKNSGTGYRLAPGAGRDLSLFNKTPAGDVVGS